MHAGHDYDLIVNDSVEKAVRETTQICTTGVAVNNRKAVGVYYQSFNYYLTAARNSLPRPAH
jgi:hypothetical protein